MEEASEEGASSESPPASSASLCWEVLLSESLGSSEASSGGLCTPYLPAATLRRLEKSHRRRDRWRRLRRWSRRY